VFPYDDPIAVLGVPSYSSGSLPAILAQVGLEMTGQPYELFTFSRSNIVPVKLTIPSADWAGAPLGGGGAALHGQGVDCSSQDGHLEVTQIFWSGPDSTEPTVSDVGGGESEAPSDLVTVDYERWLLSGQPLRQISVTAPPSSVVTYKTANVMENSHC